MTLVHLSDTFSGPSLDDMKWSLGSTATSPDNLSHSVDGAFHVNLNYPVGSSYTYGDAAMRLQGIVAGGAGNFQGGSYTFKLSLPDYSPPGNNQNGARLLVSAGVWSTQVNQLFMGVELTRQTFDTTWHGYLLYQAVPVGQNAQSEVFTADLSRPYYRFSVTDHVLVENSVDGVLWSVIATGSTFNSPPQLAQMDHVAPMLSAGIYLYGSPIAGVYTTVSLDEADFIYFMPEAPEPLHVTSMASARWDVARLNLVGGLEGQRTRFSPA